MLYEDVVLAGKHGLLETVKHLEQAEHHLRAIFL